jgi:S-adenosylmethionine:diacylglycerol 3-amino-3-carboxypropyl transferase
MEAALKFITKGRFKGKDVAVALIKENFIQLLQENFEDIFPKSIEGDDESKATNKKRSRVSDGDIIEELTAKKASRASKKDEDNILTDVVAITYNQKVKQL